MIDTKGYAAKSARAKLAPFAFQRREPGPKDVLIEIRYSGICHSDIHQARNEWGGSAFPMVPGHEIAGVVSRIGSAVRRFKIGDPAGVGCFVDSCRACPNCKEGLEQYCDGLISWTYNGTEQDGKTRTQGGYSARIVVNEDYVLKIPARIPLANAAPLLCAGITTYSPLKHFGAARGRKVGVVGMGGLGHMAVKIASSMGAEVTVFSTSASKESDARLFGAKYFVLTKGKKGFSSLHNSFDLLLDTVSAEHDLNAYLALLKRDRTMVIVGVPQRPESIQAFSLIGKRRSLAGSVIGGIRETQEMLDYCAKNRIQPEVEIIPAKKINEAYERTLRGLVRYRFVIDSATL
jgi:alcohol dehydrogenase (NADP+)